MICRSLTSWRSNFTKLKSQPRIFQGKKNKICKKSIILEFTVNKPNEKFNFRLVSRVLFLHPAYSLFSFFFAQSKFVSVRCLFYQIGLDKLIFMGDTITFLNSENDKRTDSFCDQKPWLLNRKETKINYSKSPFVSHFFVFLFFYVCSMGYGRDAKRINNLIVCILIVVNDTLVFWFTKQRGW